MFCSYPRRKRQVTPAVEKADDALAFIMDFSKHKQEDGRYELVIYEVQHINASLLFPSYEGYEHAHRKQKKVFFERLISGIPFRIEYPRSRAVSNVKPGQEVFAPTVEWRGFERKLIQRMYFNVNARLQPYIPQTAVITERDLEDESALQRLLDTICQCPFVIKVDLTSRGEGNAFHLGFKDTTALKEAIKETSDKVVSPGQQFILIEALTHAASNPKKSHNDIYRCACAHSAKH